MIGEQCGHGRLNRRCYTCELEADNERMRTALTNIVRHMEIVVGPMMDISVVMEITKKALDEYRIVFLGEIK